MRLVSYTVWVVSSFLIVMAILYFHWKSTDPIEFTSFYSLAGKYFLGSLTIGLITTFGLFSMSLDITMNSGWNNYNEFSSLKEDSHYITSVSIKFCLLSWALSLLLFIVSYIPYL